MLLSLAILSASLVSGQTVEDVSPPEIKLEPNQDVLRMILNIPSAGVRYPAGNAVTSNDVGKVFPVGGNVKPPRVRFASEPDFPEKDRKAKHKGTVIVKAVVGTDGKVHNPQVVRSLGWGLDEKAVEAVKQWVFDPATKDGHAVPVYVQIEVNFKLYQ